jgi:carbon-monoxide dehydrogenase small subunit
VLTIEGLSKNPKELHPLQKAFIEKGAVQCGFCTPGLMMSAKALLDRNPNPTEEEVRHSISGNLCRCTGYSKIVDAILTAGEEIRGNSQ